MPDWLVKLYEIQRFVYPVFAGATIALFILWLMKRTQKTKKIFWIAAAVALVMLVLPFAVTAAAAIWDGITNAR